MISNATGWTDPRPARTMARILEALKDGPLTRAEISDRISVSTTGVHTYLDKLMAEPRQVYICSWVRTGGKAFRQFALGNQPHVEFRPLRTITKQRADMTPINCKVLVDALARPQTVQELAESTRSSQQYVRKYLAILLQEVPRRVYVKEWRRPDGKGPLTQVYAAGSKQDTPRRRISSAQRFQEVKADKEKYERLLLLRRIAAARRRTRTKPQTWFGALPGAQSIVQHKEAM